MSRCTQTQALHRFAALSDADAGRLKGQCLYHNSSPIPPGTLDGDAAQLLHTSVYRNPSDPVSGQSLVYVVSSDGTPVAWLDYQARLHTPPARLTAYQQAHQAQAVVALSQLTRHALGMLARLRDSRDRRDRTQHLEPAAMGLDGRALVAGAHDPTLTYWTGLNPDPAVTREHVQTLTGSPDPVVVEVFGFGDYGRCRFLELDMLSAIEHLTAGHGLTPAVVGDWLCAEGGNTAAGLSPQRVKDEFVASFAGVFDSRAAFAVAERDPARLDQPARRRGHPGLGVRRPDVRPVAVHRRLPRHSLARLPHRGVPPPGAAIMTVTSHRLASRRFTITVDQQIRPDGAVAYTVTGTHFTGLVLVEPWVTDDQAIPTHLWAVNLGEGHPLADRRSGLPVVRGCTVYGGAGPFDFADPRWPQQLVLHRLPYGGASSRQVTAAEQDIPAVMDVIATVHRQLDYGPLMLAAAQATAARRLRDCWAGLHHTRELYAEVRDDLRSSGKLAEGLQQLTPLRLLQTPTPGRWHGCVDPDVYLHADDDGDWLTCPACHGRITRLDGGDRLGSLLTAVTGHRCP